MNASALDKLAAEVRRLRIENKALQALLCDKGTVTRQEIDETIERWVQNDKESHGKL